MTHSQPHPLAGRTVRISKNVTDPAQGMVMPGAELVIEDWWDRVSGKSWMLCDGNIGCLHYAMRSGLNQLPRDDEVIYGKIGNLGHLVHVTEVDFDE